MEAQIGIRLNKKDPYKTGPFYSYFILQIFLGQPATQDQLACGLYFIHAAKDGVIRSAVQPLRLGFRLLRNADHRLREAIERILVLRLRRLDHQGLVNDEWEIVRGWVEVVI